MILPTFDSNKKRADVPIWDPCRKMFLTEQWTSRTGGHLHYIGVRVSDRFVITEHIGDYHNFSYINAIAVYAFNAGRRELIGKLEPHRQYYNTDYIRKETESILKGYMKSQLKMLGQTRSDKEIEQIVTQLVDQSYCEMTDDNSTRMLKQAKTLTSELKAKQQQEDDDICY